MKRRGIASHNTVKTRRRKATKASGASISARSGHSSGLNLQERQARELDEAREERAALAEVLRIISSSPGDLEPVFKAILENATRICEAKLGSLYLYGEGGLTLAATHNAPPAFAEARRRGPIHPAPDTALGQVIRTKQMAQVADLATTRAYIEGNPVAVDAVKLAGMRTVIAVPMLKDNRLTGIIASYRQEVRPFTEKQIALLQNFAAQAVIAIENTWLLNELRQSLQQQTATADVLKIISRSTFNLQTVFQTLIESAVRLCEADTGSITREAGSTYLQVASYGYPAELHEFMQSHPIELGRGTIIGRVVTSGKPVQIVDIAADPEFTFTQPVRLGNLHTMLGVPLLREGTPIGVIVLSRKTVRPFTDKQIELLATFADQAVIAIENVRLFEAEQQRTRELIESLEQQTATSEVLRVISSSAGQLEPIFQAMLENAVRICGANFGVLFLREGDALRRMAMHNPPAAYVEEHRRAPLVRPSAASAHGRLIATKRVVHIADLRADQAYRDAAPTTVLLVEAAGARSYLGVPMLKDDELIGTIIIYRQEIRPFTDKQIELLQNFAAQAVIAIENARLLNQLRRSLEQQTATSEVLGVISSSPGNLQPVFTAMLTNATRICGAKFGIMWLVEGDGFRVAALHNAPPAFAEARRREPVIHPHAQSPLGRAARTKNVVQIEDVTTGASYADRHPSMVALAEFGGARTIVAVPMIKDGKLVGVISIYRQEVQPFSDEQVNLLTGFAAQAVIAIENTRLLSELRKSLQQQTATADVLRVISSSPGELTPVFTTILDKALDLCEAAFGFVTTYDGERFQRAAERGVPDALAAYFRTGIDQPRPGDAHWRLLAGEGLIHNLDQMDEDAYRLGNPLRRAIVDLGGARSALVVALRKDGALLGALTVYRKEVRPFTDKQITLLQNFAAQAVIAIENARLLNELRQSLDQQTATADVLRVISSSTGDLQPVFDAMLANATRLCEASYGTMWLHENDGQMRAAARHGDLPEAFRDKWQIGILFRPSSSVPTARAFAIRKPVQVIDLKEDRSYFDRDPLALASVDVAGIRSLIAVPMLKEDTVIGTLNVYRREVRPFTDKQIELLQNFGAQAVIAIENARLLNELRESLRQQTATADVLKIISRSAFDLPTVLQTLLRSAGRLCEADQGAITQRKGDAYYRSVAYGYPQAFMDYVKDLPVELKRDTGTGRALIEHKVIHIHDVQTDPEYTWKQAQELGGFRTMLGVPMLRDGEPVGVLTLTRKEVRSFTDRQIELVTTFADQAAIAIENVRLFDEIQEKSRQLEEASQHKSQFLANMSHELRTPLNAILGYTELMADGAYGEPSEKMLGILKRLESNGKHLLGLINDVLDLSKIEAGQLVLELSDYSVQDIAQTVRSTLEPLAADKKLGFKLELAPELPAGHGDGRRLTQVLINLVGNAIKFTDAGEVAIKAEANNGSFHLSVRDTGPGISAADQARLFQEFQQADNAITKKKGGTGLGLAISKRIIEMHGGKIWVELQPGQGSTFAFTLPVVVEQQVNVEPK